MLNKSKTSYLILLKGMFRFFFAVIIIVVCETSDEGVKISAISCAG